MANISKNGMSPVITSVILFSILFVVVVYNVYLMYDFLELQAEYTEFEMAKDSMIYLADLIEKISFSKGSSGFIRINTRTGGPSYTEDFLPPLELIVEVDGNEVVHIMDDSPGAVLYRGGSLVSVPGNQTLKGSNELIIFEADEPLVLVNTTQSNGAIIFCTTYRFRIQKLGIINYTDENGIPHPYYLIEISYINLTKGRMGGFETITITVKNKNIKSEIITSPRGDITIKAYVNSVEKQTETISKDEIPENCDIAFIVNIATVEISIGG